MDTNLKRFILLLITVALLGLVTAAVYQYVDGLRDPDHDGIPTYKDPHPYQYDGNIDSDGDGWTNHYEQLAGTDLADPDQDHDGLLDGADADGDGMSNWFERNVAGLDPLVPNERYYVQVMATPNSTVNETLNREFWITDEKIKPENYIVQYNTTLPEFLAIIDNLSHRVTANDFVYLYLRTHGGTTNGTADEPVLCFANETYPSEYDKCGALITYRELNGYLNRITSKAMAVVYSSCAENAAVAVLAESPRPRIVIATMDALAGIPSEDARTTSNSTSHGYFSVMDVIDAIRRDPNNKFPLAERISDESNIAGSFYFGDYPKALFVEDHMNAATTAASHHVRSTWDALFGRHDAWTEAESA